MNEFDISERLSDKKAECLHRPDCAINAVSKIPLNKIRKYIISDHRSIQLMIVQNNKCYWVDWMVWVNKDSAVSLLMIE